MQPSSARYSSEILPERRLRLIVVGSGLALSLLGAAVLAAMPLNLWLKLAGIAGWLAYSVWSGLKILGRYRSVVRYRIFADGTVELVRADGHIVSGRLGPGTVLLPRLAWLRVSLPAGGAMAELLAGDPRTSQQWRRFQVICRHVAAC